MDNENKQPRPSEKGKFPRINSTLPHSSSNLGERKGSLDKEVKTQDKPAKAEPFEGVIKKTIKKTIQEDGVTKTIESAVTAYTYVSNDGEHVFVTANTKDCPFSSSEPKEFDGDGRKILQFVSDMNLDGHASETLQNLYLALLSKIPPHQIEESYNLEISKITIGGQEAEIAVNYKFLHDKLINGEDPLFIEKMIKALNNEQISAIIKSDNELRATNKARAENPDTSINLRPQENQCLNVILNKLSELPPPFGPERTGELRTLTYEKVLLAAIESGKVVDFNSFVEFASQNYETYAKVLENTEIAEKLKTALLETSQTGQFAEFFAIYNLVSESNNAGKIMPQEKLEKLGITICEQIVTNALQGKDIEKLDLIFSRDSGPSKEMVDSLNLKLKDAHKGATSLQQYQNLRAVAERCQTYTNEQNKANSQSAIHDGAIIEEIAKAVKSGNIDSYQNIKPEYFNRQENTYLLGTLSQATQESFGDKQFEFAEISIAAPAVEATKKTPPPPPAPKTPKKYGTLTFPKNPFAKSGTLKAPLTTTVLNEAKTEQAKPAEVLPVTTLREILKKFPQGNSSLHTSMINIFSTLPQSPLAEKPQRSSLGEQKETANLEQKNPAGTAQQVKRDSLEANPAQVTAIYNILTKAVITGKEADSLLLADKEISTYLKSNGADIEHLPAALENAFKTATTEADFQRIYSTAKKYQNIPGSKISDQMLAKYSDSFEINTTTTIFEKLSKNDFVGIDELFLQLKPETQAGFLDKKIGNKTIIDLIKETQKSNPERNILLHTSQILGILKSAQQINTASPQELFEKLDLEIKKFNGTNLGPVEEVRTRLMRNKETNKEEVYKKVDAFYHQIIGKNIEQALENPSPKAQEKCKQNIIKALTNLSPHSKLIRTETMEALFQACAPNNSITSAIITNLKEGEVEMLQLSEKAVARHRGHLYNGFIANFSSQFQNAQAIRQFAHKYDVYSPVEKKVFLDNAIFEKHYHIAAEMIKHDNSNGKTHNPEKSISVFKNALCVAICEGMKSNNIDTIDAIITRAHQSMPGLSLNLADLIQAVEKKSLNKLAPFIDVLPFSKEQVKTLCLYCAEGKQERADNFANLPQNVREVMLNAALNERVDGNISENAQKFYMNMSKEERHALDDSTLVQLHPKEFDQFMQQIKGYAAFTSLGINTEDKSIGDGPRDKSNGFLGSIPPRLQVAFLTKVLTDESYKSAEKSAENERFVIDLILPEIGLSACKFIKDNFEKYPQIHHNPAIKKAFLEHYANLQHPLVQAQRCKKGLNMLIREDDKQNPDFKIDLNLIATLFSDIPASPDISGSLEISPDKKQAYLEKEKADLAIHDLLSEIKNPEIVRKAAETTLSLKDSLEADHFVKGLKETAAQRVLLKTYDNCIKGYTDKKQVGGGHVRDFITAGIQTQQAFFERAVAEGNKDIFIKNTFQTALDFGRGDIFKYAKQVHDEFNTLYQNIINGSELSALMAMTETAQKAFCIKIKVEGHQDQFTATLQAKIQNGTATEQTEAQKLLTDLEAVQVEKSNNPVQVTEQFRTAMIASTRSKFIYLTPQQQADTLIAEYNNTPPNKQLAYLQQNIKYLKAGTFELLAADKNLCSNLLYAGENLLGGKAIKTLSEMPGVFNNKDAQQLETPLRSGSETKSPLLSAQAQPEPSPLVVGEWKEPEQAPIKRRTTIAPPPPPRTSIAVSQATEQQPDAVEEMRGRSNSKLPPPPPATHLAQELTRRSTQSSPGLPPQ